MLKAEIKRIRNGMNLGQRAFADHVGLNPRTIWKIERGDTPHPFSLERLCRILRKTPQMLMSEREWGAWRDKFPGEAVRYLPNEKPPVCACGCGDRVKRVSHTKLKVGRKGEWGKYIQGHWGTWTGIPHNLSKDRNAYMKAYWKLNAEELRAKSRDKNARLKAFVIDYYSNGKNCCACCGVTGIEFLTIDHIIPKCRRRSIDCGTGLYANLKKRKFPTGFQVLCFNCNCAKRTNDVCPHQLKKTP
jgi:transcriptional regulator with XRE-family HTH domain